MIVFQAAVKGACVMRLEVVNKGKPAKHGDYHVSGFAIPLEGEKRTFDRVYVEDVPRSPDPVAFLLALLARMPEVPR